MTQQTQTDAGYSHLALKTLIAAALRAVDPAEAVRRHVRREGDLLHVDDMAYDLARDFDEVVLIAVGKAAVPMAEAAHALIGDKMTRGVVATKYGHTPAATPLREVARLTLLESAHPVPDDNSARAGELVAQAISNSTARTLMLACISGGASALMIAPQPGIRLSTMQAINDALLRSGADIREMNIVRSRLDRLKGGGLARLAAPAAVQGLILSDVIGDPLDVIASGLTNDPRARNVLVANNTQACEAVAAAAHELGYETRIVTTELRGEARERAREIVQTASQNTREADRAQSTETGVRRCLVYGGETTVTLRGNGKGGRNQEIALVAAIEMDEATGGGLPARPTCVASFGTDGTDGPTDAAGAIATPDTCARARALGMNPQDYLERNDSYHFFQALGDLIMTGPTGTNVADVVIALCGV
jgi:glycerate 2-kinase